MTKGKRRLVEWGKSLLIILLAGSALLLLGNTQLYANGAAAAGGNWFLTALHTLPLWGQGEETDSGWSGGTMVRPVRLVITAPQGRAGYQYDSEAVGNLFSELTNTLADALTSAGTPEETTAARFRAALRGKTPGVYLDFLGQLPLVNLSAWLNGGRAPADLADTPVRRLVLTVTESGDVALYYINEETGLYYVSKTSPDLAERLTLFAEEVSPNGAIFAFEAGKSYEVLDPYTLLSGGSTPKLGAYQAFNPVSLTETGGSSEYGTAVDSLVRSLSFHPQSPSYRYGGGGGLAIQEGSEQLRISENGLVTFEAADLESPRFSLNRGKKLISRGELVSGAWEFAERVLVPLCGEAGLYVMDVQENNSGSLIVLLGYQLDGAPVLVGREGYAARLEIRNGSITAFRMQLRSYVYQGTGVAVLPELQATAALQGNGENGLELMLCYPDAMGDSVTAQWGVF